MAATGFRALILCLGLFACEASMAGVTRLSAPGWNGLGERQREILAPLAEEWGDLSAVQRRKWIGIAGRYDGLSAEEQGRIQTRMRDWARLQPAQRQQARSQYRLLRDGAAAGRRGNLSVEWERYQSLPPEERGQPPAQGVVSGQGAQ